MAEFQALRYFRVYRLQCKPDTKEFGDKFQRKGAGTWLRGWRDWRLDTVDRIRGYKFHLHTGFVI